MGSVSVRELLTSLPDTTVYAGHEGLDNHISTISFIDAPSSVEWLNGGEVILTTAFLYKEHDEMQVRFVQKLIEMGVVALGIKIGRYIDELPVEAIAYADKHNFPIFGISFNTVWSEIFSSFHVLRLDKEEAKSILNTEMITFDRLFRSSSWGQEAIQTTFLKCIKLPGVIADESYSILCRKGGIVIHELETYCERCSRNSANSEIPDNFVSHSTQMNKFYDVALYGGERLVLCFHDGIAIPQDEMTWITSLYESIRKKNKFTQDAPVMWKNFISECIVAGLDDNYKDYARQLQFNENITGTVLLFAGTLASQARDEFKRSLRTAISNGAVTIHDDENDDEIVLIYIKNNHEKETHFSIELRGMLQKVTHSCEGCRISVGDNSRQMKDFRRLYQQAKTAMELNSQLHLDEEVAFYSDYMIFDLLRGGNFDFSEISYLNEQITTFDACTTLEIYLESGNPKRAAERQFIHDNTMRYRINKLEQCLNMDLSKPLNRTILLLKIKLWRLAG